MTGDDGERIIPARAGFTITPPGILRGTRDHPRSRGVYRGEAGGGRLVGGSSPLARGLREAHHSRRLSRGIIPARAGFTICASRREPSPIGSSPLARGLPASGVGLDPAPRIIPARAGFTFNAVSKIKEGEDHPRSRGVYRARAIRICLKSGSSPLARGLLQLPDLGQERGRIIPARAGFTVRFEGGPPADGDHPRSRGVYAHHNFAIGGGGGSSPLARGLRPAEGHSALRHRIIPARAGFTLADPWNPNEPILYQTPVAFTADLGPARRVVVAPPRQE